MVTVGAVLPTVIWIVRDCDFDAHLSECEGCRTHLEQMRITVRLVRESQQLEQRPEVAGLLAAFRAFRRGA